MGAGFAICSLVMSRFIDYSKSWKAMEALEADSVKKPSGA
jgi:hypothetical protein